MCMVTENQVFQLAHGIVHTTYVVVQKMFTAAPVLIMLWITLESTYLFS